jgi:hypothetical protein
MIKRFFTAYKALLRAEILVGAGFFGGCAYIGFLHGIGAIR